PRGRHRNSSDIGAVVNQLHPRTVGGGARPWSLGSADPNEGQKPVIVHAEGEARALAVFGRGVAGGITQQIIGEIETETIRRLGGAAADPQVKSGREPI